MELASQKAFTKLLEVLKKSDQSFLNPQKALSHQTHVEGYRHLMHLLSCGIDFYLESDPYRPAFVIFATPFKKILGDNVDSIYYFTQIRGDQTYQIKGQRGEDCYLGFTIYGGKPNGEWSDRVTININHRQVEFAEDGSFEITLTPNPQKDQEFKLDEDSVAIITREYFFRPFESKRGDFKIENVNPPEAPQPITDEELALRLKAVTTFIEHNTRMLPFPSFFNQNQLGQAFAFPMDQKGWGTPDNIYAMGNYKLEDDEVLVIQGNIPKCVYWGAQTWNSYMQSLDYRHHKVNVNSESAQLNEDGTFEIYVSPQEIDHPNWVGTAGTKEGMVFCRWLLAEEMPEQPKVTVKKVSELF